MILCTAASTYYLCLTSWLCRIVLRFHLMHERTHVSTYRCPATKEQDIVIRTHPKSQRNLTKTMLMPSSTNQGIIRTQFASKYKVIPNRSFVVRFLENSFLLSTEPATPSALCLLLCILHLGFSLVDLVHDCLVEVVHSLVELLIGVVAVVLDFLLSIRPVSLELGVDVARLGLDLCDLEIGQQVGTVSAQCRTYSVVDLGACLLSEDLGLGLPFLCLALGVVSSPG